MARTSKTINIRIQGVKQLKLAFGYMGASSIGALGLAINHEINDILMESRDLVPYDTGSLWDSGRLEEVQEGKSSALAKKNPSGPILEGRVIYGNEDVDYAAAVHERLELAHEAPRDAKYLEQVAAPREKSFGRRLATLMWAHLEFVTSTTRKWKAL